MQLALHKFELVASYIGREINVVADNAWFSIPSGISLNDADAGYDVKNANVL